MSQHPSENRGNTAIVAIVIAVVVLGVVAWFVFGRQKANTNTVTNTNSNTNSVVTQSYTDSIAGVSFTYPSTSFVKVQAVSGGSFESTLATHAVVIEPENNTLDYPPAARCVIQVFPSNNMSLSNWVTQSGLYTPTGISIISQKNLTIDTIEGVDVSEGGPNAQRTRSFFFQTIDSTNVVRFGYYLGGDTRPQEDLQNFIKTCETILTSFTRE